MKPTQGSFVDIGRQGFDFVGKIPNKWHNVCVCRRQPCNEIASDLIARNVKGAYDQGQGHDAEASNQLLHKSEIRRAIDNRTFYIVQ